MSVSYSTLFSNMRFILSIINGVQDMSVIADYISSNYSII